MTITANGTLQPDGITVQLDKKVALAPGRVTVEVRPAVTSSGPTMLEVLERIHRDQQRRGHVPMTEEEMAREIEEMRQDDEERWTEIWSQTSKSANLDAARLI